jgi:hypothetical protein
MSAGIMRFRHRAALSSMRATLALSFAVSLCAAVAEPAASEKTIWFDAPAKDFTESCPMGKGRLGAMMFGSVLLTRINSLLLTGVLSVAILQNLLANRDPQLAVLYTLVMVTLVLMGGGRFSCGDCWP